MAADAQLYLGFTTFFAAGGLFGLRVAVVEPSATTSGFRGLPSPQKYVKIMAFMAIIRGLELLFYILLGFR